MKTNLLANLIMFFLAGSLMGGCESAEPTVADTFLDYGLVTEEEYQRLKQAEDSLVDLQSAQSILKWLETDFPDLPSSFPMIASDIYVAGYEYIPQEELLHLVEGMKKMELLDPEAHKILLQAIEREQVVSREEVRNWPAYYQDYAPYAGPSRLQEIAESWTALGLMNPESQQAYKQLISENALEAVHTFPDYLQPRVSYSNQGWDIYQEGEIPRIFDTLMTLIPEAELEHLEFRIDTVPYDPMSVPATFLKVPTEIRLDGRRYKYILWADYIAHQDPNPDPPPGVFPLLPQMLCVLLNQYFKELGSEDRIMILKPSQGNLLDGTGEGGIHFIRINREQYQATMVNQIVPWYVDDLHYAPTLSRAEVDSLLDLLKPFASGLSRADWQAIQRDAFLQGLERRGELVYNVPNLVCKGKIYWGSKVNPYPVLFEDLQRISRGWFEPEDLKFEAHASRERVWEVSFRLANREFREELSLEGGYLDVEFIDVPNKALAEIGVEGRFRHFDYFGESMSYIFLSPKQEEKLKENRLLKILE